MCASILSRNHDWREPQLSRQSQELFSRPLLRVSWLFPSKFVLLAEEKGGGARGAGVCGPEAHAGVTASQPGKEILSSETRGTLNSYTSHVPRAIFLQVQGPLVDDLRLGKPQHQVSGPGHHGHPSPRPLPQI
jgi:hypothetical protein